MLLQKWNVWHTYGTYFLESITDIYAIGKKIVEAGLARSTFHSDGISWYSDKDDVKMSSVEIERFGYTRDAKVSLPNIKDDYALETTLLSARMRVAEMMVHSEVTLDIPYVRACLDEIRILVEEQLILLYPQIKIFENGVFLVEFRTIGPDADYHVNNFIDRNINLFTHIAENIEVPPNLFILFNRYLHSETSWSPMKLIRLRNIRKETYANVEQLSYSDDEQDDAGFGFKYFSLGKGYTLKHIFDFIKYALLIALGARLTLGSYWFGRPSVYLYQFQNQPTTASDIYTTYRKELNKIAGRTTSENINSDFFGMNLRAFEDFVLHFSKSLTLVVYGRQKKNNIFKLSASHKKKFNDPNLDEIYGEHQIKAELIDYTYALYNRLLERSSLEAKGIKNILKEKEQLYYQEGILNSYGNHGELNDLYCYAWKALELDKIRTRIENNINLKLSILSELRGQRIQRFGWILSIIFGLSGTANISEHFVQPIWKHIGTVPSNIELFVQLTFMSCDFKNCSTVSAGRLPMFRYPRWGRS